MAGDLRVSLRVGKPINYINVPILGGGERSVRIIVIEEEEGAATHPLTNEEAW